MRSHRVPSSPQTTPAPKNSSLYHHFCVLLPANLTQEIPTRLQAYVLMVGDWAFSQEMALLPKQTAKAVFMVELGLLTLLTPHV